VFFLDKKFADRFWPWLYIVLKKYSDEETRNMIIEEWCIVCVIPLRGHLSFTEHKRCTNNFDMTDCQVEMMRGRVDLRRTPKWRSRLDNSGAMCVYVRPFTTASTNGEETEEDNIDRSEWEKRWLHPARW